jgi:hypothetical protein
MDAETEKPKRKLFNLPYTGIGLGITGTFSAAMLEPEVFKGLLTAAWREDVVRWLVALFIAGILHRLIFRKDIERQLMKMVSPLVNALNKVADCSEQTGKQLVAMNSTMGEHGKRLDLIEQHLTPRQPHT